MAMVDPAEIGTIKSCDGEWCQMKMSNRSGWLSQSLLWGTHPGEKIRGG